MTIDRDTQLRNDATEGRPQVGLSRSGSGRLHFEVTHRIDVPREVVWELFIDTRRWPDWGPSVRAVEASDTVIQTATTGRVRTIGDIWVPFRITSCEDYRWTWRIARIPATGHRVDRCSGETCRAVFEVPLVAGGYIPVCRRALTRIASLAAAPIETDT